MPAWGPQPHQLGSLALNTGGGGPTLVRRLFFYANQSGILMPAGAAWMIARGLGFGGTGAIFDSSGGVFGAGGASAAFSRTALNPGAAAIAATVSQAVGTNTSLTVGGVEILRAASATAPTDSGNNAPGTPGLASASIGDVTVSGSPGGFASGNPGSGANAPQEPGTNPLMPAGLGGVSGSRTAAFGAGGAGGGQTNNGGPSAGIGGTGLIILEFWSGKP